MRLIVFLFFNIFIGVIFSKAQQNILPIMPKPESAKVTQGSLYLKGKFGVSVSDTFLLPVVRTFSQQIKGLATPIISAQRITLQIILDNANTKDEAYSLSISRDKIVIKAATDHGAFNALESLRQLMIVANRRKAT